MPPFGGARQSEASGILGGQLRGAQRPLALLPGKRFGVCCLTDNVRQTFTISGFSSIIAIHDTVEDAVSAAQQ